MRGFAAMVLIDGFAFGVQSRLRAMIGSPRPQSASGCGQNGYGTAQIVGAARQHCVHLVSDQCKEAHAAQAVVLLDNRKRPLHAGAYAADQSIAPLVPRGQAG